MGAFGYCQHDDYGVICGQPLNAPTLRQALRLEPWTCKWGHSTLVRDSNVTEAIAKQFEALIERVETIERHLWPEDES